MDPLDPSALLETLPKLLPASSEGSENAAAQLRSPQDGLAALAHTIMTRLDFRLVNLGEGHKIEPRADSSSSSSTVSLNELPAEWKKSAPELYTFGYRHEQSSLEFIVKVVRMANRTMINATAVEDNKTATYEVPTADYTSASFFSASTRDEPLVNGFISSSRLRDFVLAYKQLIVQRLVPGLRKEGYEEAPSADSGVGASGSRPPGQPPGRGGDEEERRRPYNSADPVGPRPPNRPPYFDEPDDPSMPRGLPGGRNPLIIGDRDLDPLGGAPFAAPRPFGGGGSAGFGPPPLFGGGNNGGGMIVGPDHPMFRDRFQPGGIGPLGGGNGGGQGNLPQGAVPPGARFDPIGPFGPGPRFPQGPGSAGRGRGGPGSGEPDFDDFRPPGNSNYDSMFG